MRPTTARRVRCAKCRSTDVYRLRDHRKRLICTRPIVYACAWCGTAFTARPRTAAAR